MLRELEATERITLPGERAKRFEDALDHRCVARGDRGLEKRRSGRGDLEDVLATFTMYPRKRDDAHSMAATIVMSTGPNFRRGKSERRGTERIRTAVLLAEACCSPR